MDRKANYFFLLSLIVVFVLQADAEEHARILIGALYAAFFCTAAFIFRWLSLDGAVAAFVSGTVVLGLGGYSAALVLLLFFVSSTLISKELELPAEEGSHDYFEKNRRDGLQVWSNGFWFTLFLMLAFWFRNDLLTAAALGAIATATADTWATELGSKRFKAKTYLLDEFTEVEAGTDGGVSIPGTAAAFLGSLIIAIITVVLYSEGSGYFFPVLLAGFLGCLADSYFGARFQRQGYHFELPAIFNGLHVRFNNNMVNWLASGAGSVTALILKLF